VILFEARGPVGIATVNRPEAMNAIDSATNSQLQDVWRQFDADPALRVAVITGAGDRAFCAGADLKQLIPEIRERTRRGVDQVWNSGGLTRGFRTDKPIIAAINGHCLAGGLELALACDIRVCSPNARFGLSEVRWAIIPGAGGTQRLPRAVPVGIAMEMILTGEPIDAEEAYRVGLVNRVVPLPELLPAALRPAETIAARVRSARPRPCRPRRGQAWGLLSHFLRLLPRSAISGGGSTRRRCVVTGPGGVVADRGRSHIRIPLRLGGRCAHVHPNLEHLMSTYPSSTHPIRRLTRLEQLTLNTCRRAAVKLRDTHDPPAVLEHAALHAVLASLRDLDDPLALFVREPYPGPTAVPHVGCRGLRPAARARIPVRAP